MSYTAVIYGTPSGYEELYPEQFGASQNESGSNVDTMQGDRLRLTKVLRAQNGALTYHAMGGLLLGDPNASGDTVKPSVWLIQRVGWRLHTQGTGQPEHELLFCGCYTHAYEMPRGGMGGGARPGGFYGAGVWFDRTQWHWEGGAIRHIAQTSSHAIREHCLRDPNNGFYLDRFSYRLSERRVQTQLQSKFSALQFKTPKANQARTPIHPRQFQDGAYAYVQLDCEANNIVSCDQVVAQFLESVQTNPSLLEYEVIYASTSPYVSHVIKEWRSNQHMVPVRLHSVNFFNLNNKGLQRLLQAPPHVAPPSSTSLSVQHHKPVGVQFQTADWGASDALAVTTVESSQTIDTSGSIASDALNRLGHNDSSPKLLNRMDIAALGETTKTDKEDKAYSDLLIEMEDLKEKSKALEEQLSRSRYTQQGLFARMWGWLFGRP